MRRGVSSSILTSWPVRLPETFTEKGGDDIPRLNTLLYDLHNVYCWEKEVD